MKLKKSPKGVADIRYAGQVRSIRGTHSGSLSDEIRVQREISQISDKPKGTFDGPCNITACQKPGARVFMEGMNAYYCVACARDMIEWDHKMVEQGQQSFHRFPQGLVRDSVDQRK